MELIEAAKEAVFLLKFLKEVELEQQTVIRIYNDNQGAKKLAKNPVFHSRSKHAEIRHHFVRESLLEGWIIVDYISSGEMMADMFTKDLGGLKHQKCLTQFGMRNFGEKKKDTDLA